VDPWFDKPNYFLLVAIIISVAFIQFIERQPLPLTGLLLRDHLPQPQWLQTILLDETGASGSLYFSSLLLVTAGCILLWWQA
jgi:hypothetical protein